MKRKILHYASLILLSLGFGEFIVGLIMLIHHNYFGWEMVLTNLVITYSFIALSGLAFIAKMMCEE